MWFTPLEKLTSKISEQEDELKALQIQYKNVVLEQGKNSCEAKEIASQIKDLNGDIKENKDKLNEAEKSTDEPGNEMDDTAKQTNIYFWLSFRSKFCFEYDETRTFKY